MPVSVQPLWLERKCPQRLLPGSLGITPNNSRSCGAGPGRAVRGRAGHGRTGQGRRGPRKKSLTLELFLPTLSCDLLSPLSPVSDHSISSPQ